MSSDIFALDIGTRKVMGLVARRSGDILEIIDVEVVEHSGRAMQDGQIHDVEDVARIVQTVKASLESRLEAPLSKVGVAVAGRDLVTYKTNQSYELPFVQEVTQEMVRNLEFQAVEKIISDSDKQLSDFYCVGYSPVYYELDGKKISNLVGHLARCIAVELIVTFLPRMVLDGMLSVLKKCGLEAVNITLEPISAINAIVPQELRNLNIVLVDIGAGTSDLALVRDGLIFAYGMVPEAGDEITEAISQALLIDFHTAEKVKRQIESKEDISYPDIWGKQTRIKSAELKKVILPAVKKLAASISGMGLDLNGSQPQAVVVVGGGSLSHNIIQELSAGFGIPPDKVGIRLPHVISSAKDLTGKLNGPEAVTPIGIALMASQYKGLRFIDVDVNGQKLRLLDFQQKKDIMGALSLSGLMSNKRLYPRPGMALTVEVNGELKVIKGQMGEPARITLNGQPVSSLSQKIESGDVIEFQEAQDGLDAVALIKDLMVAKTVNIKFNGEQMEVLPPITIDGNNVDIDAQVPDRAQILLRDLCVRDLLKRKGVSPETLQERQILVNVNSSPRILTQRNCTVLINGRNADFDTVLKDGDNVEFFPEKPLFFRIREIINVPAENDKINISVDGQKIVVNLEPVQIYMNGQQVKPDEFLINGADIKVYYPKTRQIILSEIFRYIDFNPQQAYGKLVKITVDDKPAGFTTPLTEGSRVKILLEERQPRQF